MNVRKKKKKKKKRKRKKKKKKLTHNIDICLIRRTRQQCSVSFGWQPAHQRSDRHLLLGLGLGGVGRIGGGGVEGRVCVCVGGGGDAE